MGSLCGSSPRRHDIGLSSRWSLAFPKIHDSDRTFIKFTIVTERSEFKMGSLRRSSPRRHDIGLSSRWGHYAAVPSYGIGLGLCFRGFDIRR
jgi:hypothetical protein